MDTLTTERRSWNMSRIHSCDTTPECAVRSLLHKAGFRFRLHVKKLPGSPDLVLPRYGCVVLVHGCFWHRHAGCRYSYNPKSRVTFWRNKFTANVARDRLVRLQLRRLGWRVLVVWECETRRPEALTLRLSRQIRSTSRRNHGGIYAR